MKTTITKKSTQRTPVKTRDNSFKGTILIPDISGFTNFVNETEFTAGREITRQLLQVIIENNILNLKISEIEGDAILFYTKTALTPLEIKEQYEKMLEAFRIKVHELSAINGFKIELSLKLIAHYGELSTYLISNFEKLYGKAVIEAHKLLKNDISSKAYFLLTESVFKANKGRFKGACYYSGSQLCEVYGSLKKIGYAFFDYEKDEQLGSIRLMDEQVVEHAENQPEPANVLQRAITNLFKAKPKKSFSWKL